MRGKRSVFKKGDKIIIDPPKIVLEKQVLFVFMPCHPYCTMQLL